MKLHLIIFLLIVTTAAFGQNTASSVAGKVTFNTTSVSPSIDTYPRNAKRISFKNTGKDSLRVLKEIQFSREGNVSIGVKGIEAIYNNVYIGYNDFYRDDNSNRGNRYKVLVFDKDNYDYKFSIGDEDSSSPAFLDQMFGPLQWKGKLLVGSTRQPNLFKSFSTNGDFEKSYKNKTPFEWGISSSAHNSIIYDSIAFVVKFGASNMYQVSRLKFTNDFEKMGEDILPVTDFHIPLDSAQSMNIMSNLKLLKSNVEKDKKFYAIPPNKYLINSYNLDGKLLKSVDLRDIPEIALALQQGKELEMGMPKALKGMGGSYSYFRTVAVDKDDYIYIPVQIILNPEVIYKGLPEFTPEFVKGLAKELKINYNLIAVNLRTREYKKYALNAPANPLKVIDKKLWCYDQQSSKIMIYQLSK